MSYVIFDCSQFLTFDLRGEKLTKNNLVQFENMGMEVILREEIECRKLNYLNSFFMKDVVELFDQEFIGVFEDWKQENHPPNELIILRSALSELGSKLGINSLRLIIISRASENIEEDRLIHKMINMDQLLSELFILSNWNFSEKTDNLILTINL